MTHCTDQSMASNDLQKSTKTKNRLKTKLSKEDSALLRFKDEIADVLTSDQDDYNLQKWLKARQYDVKKAIDMYRASLAYKKKMNVEKILEEYDPPEVLKKYTTGGFLGYDKEGSPLVIEFYGHLDMKGLMYSAKKVDLEKNKIMQCETIVRDWQLQSEKRGKRVDGLTVIFDMDGVSTKMLWRPGLQMYLHLVKVLEDNYPEMLKRMFVINAPRIFPLLYKLARPLISEDTKNKIHVLGGNFKDILLKFIDAEYLPVYLGGLKTDPDGNPRCVTMICQGGEVPREYYLLDKDHEDCMDTVHVSRRQRLRFEYDVTRPGSILRWEFKTDGFDIGFGVNFLSDKEKVVLITVERVNSHIVPEDGSIVCNTAGKYEIVFDNSFSWARSKRIMYLVEIITPPEDDGIRNEIKRLQEGESMHNLRAC